MGALFCSYRRTRLYRTLKGNRNWFDIVEVRYIRTFIKANQIKEKGKPVRYDGASLYPVFDIAEFDSISLNQPYFLL